MTDRIRVKHKELGHIHSIAASRFDKSVWEKVEGPANNPDGTAVAPEFPKNRRPSSASQTPEAPAASGKPGQKAESDKENS